MTITSDHLSSLVDEPGADLLPGSTDIEWAERAYRHQPNPGPRQGPRTAVRRARRRLRTFIGAVVLVLAMAGLVVLLTTQGGSPPSTRPSPVTAPTAKVATGHVSLTPPLLRPPTLQLPILTAPTKR